MRVSVLTTDGGPHPADKWAEQSAGEIMALVKIDPDYTHDTASDKTRKQSARKTRMYLEADILEALERHHGDVQDLERELLKEGDERLNHPSNPDAGTIEAAVASVVSAAGKYGEPWASAFEDQGAKAMVHGILARHFRAAIDIAASSWHVDRQGDNRSEHAVAWRKRRTGNPA